MNASFRSTAHAPGHRALHQAWWSLLLFPLSFVMAFVVGEGIPAWIGYPEPSLDSTPWWVVTMAVVPALLVFAAPLLVTSHFTRKAVAEGEREGRLPLIIAAVAVSGFVAMNLLSGIAQLIF